MSGFLAVVDPAWSADAGGGGKGANEHYALADVSKLAEGYYGARDDNRGDLRTASGARDNTGRDLRTAVCGLARSQGKAWGLGNRFPLVERAVTQEAFGAPGLQGFGAPNRAPS